MNRPENSLQPTLPRDRLTAWLLVIGQFILLALIILLPGRASWTLPTGVGVAGVAAEVVGILVMVGAATALGRGLTAAPLPNEHAQLRTGGLYGYVRHPIYSGLLLFAVARTLTHSSGWVAVACVLLIGLINVKARWEEGHLTRRFPDYPSYASRTPRFIPWTKRR
jgi:protein-S-isoprenylcysteine O-methyltransferase Ste14